MHCGESTVSPPTNHSGPSSNPRIDAICGLSLFLVFSLAPRGFSSGPLVFSSSQKPMQLFQIPIRSGTHGHVSTCQHITIYHRNYGLLLNLQLLQICHV